MDFEIFWPIFKNSTFNVEKSFYKNTEKMDFDIFSTIFQNSTFNIEKSSYKNTEKMDLNVKKSFQKEY